jgi:hypothetical protein
MISTAERTEPLPRRVAAWFADLLEEGGVRIPHEIDRKIRGLKKLQGIRKVKQEEQTIHQEVPTIIETKLLAYAHPDADHLQLRREIHHLFANSTVMFPKRSLRGIDPIRISYIYREPHTMNFVLSGA